MFPPIYAALSAAPAVAAIVADRIYRHGDAPQNTTLPYITWQSVASVPENNLSDIPPFDRWVLQINCWHPADVGVVTLAEAVRAAVEPHGHVTGIPVNQREPQTKLYWVALQMDWLFNR